MEEMTPEEIAAQEDLLRDMAPFDYEELLPLVRQAAQLLGAYQKELIAANLSADLQTSLLYDFHRKIWGIPFFESQ